MRGFNLAQGSSNDSTFVKPQKIRRAQQSNDATIFADIYQEETNIVIWQRELSGSLKSSVAAFLESNPDFQKAMTIAPLNVVANLNKFLGTSAQSELSENIAEIVDMFCCLFELKRAGLRLVVLDSAMCPKFHVDRVPCRLVSTFQGEATEWLPHHVIDRTKLGHGSNGQPDDKSGLYQTQDDIQQLSTGDVALLKGEIWQGNENAGLVHRSPALAKAEKRLLLTLDFIS